MLRCLALVVLFIIILFGLIISNTSAATLSISGPKEVMENQKFNISIKSTVSNLAAFEITIEAENSEFVTAYRGKNIEDWAFSYQGDGQVVRIIGIYNRVPVSGTVELAKLTFKVYDNTTFTFEIKETKLIDTNEREIKIDKFYNHSVRVYRYGDINMDDKVDVKDLIRLERIILMKESKTVTSDLNNDGKVNILDLVKLIRLLVGA